MRPSLLDPLFAPVTALPGVGPKVLPLLNRLLAPADGLARVLDLLFHLPQGGVARQMRGSIKDAPAGEPVTLAVTVTAYRPPPMGRARVPFRVLCEDDTADITLAFFNMPRARIERMLPMHARRYVSGRIELWDGHRQMIHPSRIVDDAGLKDIPAVEPIYGATDGLTSRAIGRIAVTALERLPVLPEWQDPAFLQRQGFPTMPDALRAEHRPEDETRAADAEAPASPARRRLAYDELLASQLALALVRSRMHRAAGRENVGDGRLAKRVEDALPFVLTGAQARALVDIRRDMGSERRMLRLLQGDVGSGKTAVAVLAMVSAVEAGRQAALMAPTDILARQHAARIAPLAEAAGLKVALVTGRDRAAERRATLAGLADGTIDVAVGTHALFQEGVDFHDLGLAVVDEQHRFGVHQRLALGAKGEAVDILVMTATPIPRTLAPTCFGDMDVSVLDEKPAGRQPITTRIVPAERLDEVIAGLGRALAAGDRVYWICPLVQESEFSDLAAAEARFEDLKQHFGDAVGLVHGKLKGRDKDAVMDAFAAGELTLLVATTVVEVGVDVPEATIMVIEHAERFGLAQLHQLRGRIGRGSKASSCLLVYKGPIGQVAKSRLETMRQSEDGFFIAEQDLKLRGEGEILGTRQSGLAAFRLARPDLDADLLVAARDDARLVVERDPELRTPRGEALRVLLYLFERDAAIRLLGAG